MASVLGEMKGAAMKLGQLASFVDTEFLPEEYRELYQEQMAKLRSSAEPMPWEKVEQVLDDEYQGERVADTVRGLRAGGVRRGVDRPGAPRGDDRRPRVAVKVQYPGIAEALEADLANMGTIVRLAKALAPGLDPKAIAKELRERVLEELDYEHEADNQRSFSRAYRGHPFIYVPDVLTQALAPAGAGDGVRGRHRLRGGEGAGCARRAAGSARSCSASRSARSTTCSTSTPTPTRATTC